MEYEQVRCKYCGKDLNNVPGKVKKQFCSDAHRKASKRLELGKSKATASPSVAELRTTGIKLTSDSNHGQRRGKDIKCFADLPPDVQHTIEKMSVVDGKIDKTIKANRTAIAVNYQHLYPDRYYPNHFPDVRDETNTRPISVVTGKPGDADYNGVCTAEWRAERGR